METLWGSTYLRNCGDYHKPDQELQNREGLWDREEDITGWVTDTALHCWHYDKSYTLSSRGKLHYPTYAHSPTHAHSPGKLCRPLLCASHGLCHSCPQKGGNHWAWCTGSLPGSKDHTAYRRTWPPPWRLRPLRVPCTLQTHTRKPNSSKFSKGGSNQNKTQIYHSPLFIVGSLV